MGDKKQKDLLVPPKGGVVRDFVNRIKLILRLMGDKRVNFFLKLLPLASVAYLFWPLDLASGIVLPVIGALDDAAILWLGSYLFLELCPPDVVQEHMKALTSNMDMVEGDDVVNGESTDVTDKP
jgi:uncharacterized membrane protein YkvA (DUF1232 family)